MKRKYVYNLGFIIFLACIISCDSKPDIRFSSEQLEIGTVEAGTGKKVNTVLKNIGGDTLFIKEVSAGCQCTDVKISSNRVAPGAQAKLQLTYFANNDLPDSSPINVAVVIRSNARKEFHEFYLKGVVKKKKLRLNL
ncbi:DUF1573 domain-containing protein [Sphingobacterium griseoflavum]|nr:DUF1573 domain-containing protein [Sphingobacterium griseoflavum]